MHSFVFLIPNLNGRHLLERCYTSILGQTEICARAVLIDNGSTDGSIEWTEKNYPEVQIVRGRAEWGFARAINEGIKATTSEWVVLFNNDAWLADDFGENVQTGIAELPQTKAFACCGISGRDESLFYSLGDVIYNGCPLRVGYLKPRDSVNLSDLPNEVVCPSGYAAIYHRSLFDELGLLPEPFHSFYEDGDFGMRTLRAGYQCHLLKDTVVYHLGGETGHFKGSNSDPMVLRAAWTSGRNGIWFVRRHFAPLQDPSVLKSAIIIPLWQQFRWGMIRRSPGNLARFYGMLNGIIHPAPDDFMGLLPPAPVNQPHQAKVNQIWDMWRPWMEDIWGFGKTALKRQA